MRPRLSKHDCVVTAFAQVANGPGWSNTPLWVIVQDGNGKLRRECLQPEEQTEVIHLLYALSNTMNAQLTNEVERIMRVKKVRKKHGSNR